MTRFDLIVPRFFSNRNDIHTGCMAELLQELFAVFPRQTELPLVSHSKTRNDGAQNVSIGQSQVPAVKRYVARQKEHHSRVNYQDEYRKFLKLYDVEYDERYVWD